MREGTLLRKDERARRFSSSWEDSVWLLGGTLGFAIGRFGWRVADPCDAVYMGTSKELSTGTTCGEYGCENTGGGAGV